MLAWIAASVASEATPVAMKPSSNEPHYKVAIRVAVGTSAHARALEDNEAQIAVLLKAGTRASSSRQAVEIQAWRMHRKWWRRHVQKLPFALFELSPPVAKMIAPRLRIG